MPRRRLRPGTGVLGLSRPTVLIGGLIGALVFAGTCVEPTGRKTNATPNVANAAVVPANDAIAIRCIDTAGRFLAGHRAPPEWKRTATKKL
jgi:hypothetical protein